MTLTLDLPAELETRLHARATRCGVPAEALALEVLSAGLTDESPLAANSPIAQALALLDELTPVIQAGTRHAGVPLDAAAELAALREERFADV